MFDDGYEQENIHPDLKEIDEALGRRLEMVLAAEQEAAAVLMRRSTGLRARLVEAEDRAAGAVVITEVGEHRGQVTAVGRDHVELMDAGRLTIVPLKRIVTVIL